MNYIQGELNLDNKDFIIFKIEKSKVNTLDRYKIGKYIDENIEDYVFKKEREGYALRLKLNKYEKPMVVSFTVVLILSAIFVFINYGIVDIRVGYEDGLDLLRRAFIFFSTIVGIPIIIAMMYLFTYATVLYLGGYILDYSLEELEKEEYDSISKEYGYKLKMLEEFDTQLHDLVRKWNKRNLPIEVTHEDLDDMFKELVKDLNTEVMLGNWTITNKYEIITIDKGDIKYSTDFKELGKDRLETGCKLNEQSAIEWYKNLTGLNKLNKRE